MLPLALLFTPALGLAVLMALASIAPAFAPGLVASPSLAMLALGLAGGFAIGFIEEIGWTGFALRKLTPLRGAAASAVVVGVLHGLWHLPAGWWGEGARFGGWFALYFLTFWIVGLVGLRMLIAALYARTQNLLLAQLAHASYTGGFFLIWPAAASPQQHVVWTGIFAGVYLAASWLALRTLSASVGVEEGLSLN